MTLTKEFVRKLLPLLAILPMATWFGTYAPGSNEDITTQDAERIAAGSSIASGPTSIQVSSGCHSSQIPKISDYVESNPGEEFPFWIFVTPGDQTIEALAAQISGPGDAYQMAVQWIYISEKKLNHVADKWLTPHEFLANTPYYSSNPLKGKEASDCEEQANTLVSLIRAEGIRPEEVRVALGEVTFNDVETGHAWAEILTDGHWLALDPSWGPYWDDRAGKLIRRRGIPFDYYGSHHYPVLQVWAYYNDIYYLDTRCDSSNAPASWLEGTFAVGTS